MHVQSTTYGATVDPVCGMTVDPGRACKTRFDANPERFIAKTESGPGPRGHSHGCCGQ
jgi:YHS domain-containing protein